MAKVVVAFEQENDAIASLDDLERVRIEHVSRHADRQASRFGIVFEIVSTR